MKKGIKGLLIGVSAVLILIIALGVLQALVVPKYITNPEGALSGEYYADAGGHDVIFVGDCEVYESFVPSVLWESNGITSYVRGSAQQLAWHSYYILEETFKYESPQVVVFNVLALKYGEPQSEAFNRMTLDTMKWSPAKIKAIYASMTEEESFADYLFPILRYHARITELEKNDFKYWFKDVPHISDNGYLMQAAVVPMENENEEGRELLDYTLPSASMEYLTKMKELCDKNGAELVLVKAPTNSWGYYWYDEWEEQIVDYADKNGLDYYNFIPLCEEIGIDWSTDTYDAGMHLNVYGAEKLSRYFGAILAQKHGIVDRRGEADVAARWGEYLEEYRQRKKMLEDAEIAKLTEDK